MLDYLVGRWYPEPVTFSLISFKSFLIARLATPAVNTEPSLRQAGSAAACTQDMKSCTISVT